MFESIRKSLNDLLDRATAPEDRRAIAARMRDTLVQAKVGLEEMREGITKTRQRLELASRELETTRRRRALAEGIGDAETVRVATQYEATQAERLEILERKLAAQEGELGLAEREVSEMTAELRAVMSGARPAGAPSLEAEAAEELERELGDSEAGGGAGRETAAEIDALGRQRARADREADAARRLEELKRRMGK